MNKSIERAIKDQYAKIFTKNDWLIFKSAAEYYFETASKILKKDIKYGTAGLKLLRRNVQKRLYIGIAYELLLKAIFLKNGYCINKAKDRKTTKGDLHKLLKIKTADFKDDDTLSFAQLMDQLNKIIDFGAEKKVIDKGLRIAKVFRNKEGHVVVHWHDYDPENYRDIESSLIAFYNLAFNQTLKIQFSVSDGEKAIFKIKTLENYN